MEGNMQVDKSIDKQKIQRRRKKAHDKKLKALDRQREKHDKEQKKKKLMAVRKEKQERLEQLKRQKEEGDNKIRSVILADFQWPLLGAQFPFDTTGTGLVFLDLERIINLNDTVDENTIDSMNPEELDGLIISTLTPDTPGNRKDAWRKAAKKRLRQLTTDHGNYSLIP
jgi:hypothetical protein